MLQLKLALSNGYLLNASRAAIAFNQLNILNGLRYQLGEKVRSVKDQSLEQPPCLDSAGELLSECESIHVP